MVLINVFWYLWINYFVIKKKKKNMDFEFLVYINFNVWLIFIDFINSERYICFI